MNDEESELQCCPCGDESHPSPAAIDAINVAFPLAFQGIVKELRYHAGDDFWSFNRFGMFVGVERDGYIHS